MELAALLHKYNKKAPRYTSYPPASSWAHIDPLQFFSAITKMPHHSPFEAYVHIPFCASLCSYCGCFTLGHCTKTDVEQYVDTLCQEITLTSTMQKNSLSAIHFGGGTPTYLPYTLLKKIIDSFYSTYHIPTPLHLSIEVDPRTVTHKTLAALSSLHFSRISLGIQDFDETVQEAIGRHQSQEHSIKTILFCKTLPFSSIHLDLIYGLPRQTLRSFEKTIETTITLRPNRISLFAFAYIPEIKPLQKNIDPTLLPSPIDKATMFLQAKIQLLNAGYKSLGLDHFVLPHDPLYIAYEKKMVHRNFQGYTENYGQTFGYGLSAISSIQGAYFQNDKDLSLYIKNISSKRGATTHGYIPTFDDTVRKYVIEQLLTYASLDKSTLQQRWGISFDQYFSLERKHLQPYIFDGLLIEDDTTIFITENGTFFIRTIASVFDTFAPYCHAVRTV